MLYEDLRLIHEDNERLEQAIVDRGMSEPGHIRGRLIRDHEIATFLHRAHDQSQRALRIYEDKPALTQEEQSVGTGDVYGGFYKKLAEIKDFHKRYPNEPIENLERAYKRPEDGGPPFAGDIDSMFTGEEAFGKFFDLTMLYEEYINFPSIKNWKRLPYLQYLEVFDKFVPPPNREYVVASKGDKMTDPYFSYVGSLAQYLESFMRRTRPLEDFDQLFSQFDEEFDKLWEEDKVEGWGKNPQTNGTSSNGPTTEGTGEGVWCADCGKEFKNDNVYKAHLTGKKHIKNAQARQQSGNKPPTTNGTLPVPNGQRLKERAIAQREHRIQKLSAAMSTVRSDTRVNVERKSGMTDRERQIELAELYGDTEMTGTEAANPDEDAEPADGEEKLYNPLKLPLAWDGKPIPFWLYKLHGLGVEFPCEICGNYVYMGRRAFDRHFSEARHVYGLKCLGITSNTSLFREITGIEEALRLWEKIRRDKEEKEEVGKGVEEMEDSMGNVMPRKVYDDLAKAGLL